MNSPLYAKCKHNGIAYSTIVNNMRFRSFKQSLSIEKLFPFENDSFITQHTPKPKNCLSLNNSSQKKNFSFTPMKPIIAPKTNSLLDIETAFLKKFGNIQRNFTVS